jgi:hypothetical protein
MPNKFHDDAHFQQLALSVCENVFEQQVSKFPFEMTQAAAACWSWAATHSHHTENSSRAMRGGWMCCARSACGVTHVNPLPCIIMHTQDAHIKTRATAFFSARADNAALAVSNAHNIL